MTTVRKPVQRGRNRDQESRHPCQPCLGPSHPCFQSPPGGPVTGAAAQGGCEVCTSVRVRTQHTHPHVIACSSHKPDSGPDCSGEHVRWHHVTRGKAHPGTRNQQQVLFYRALWRQQTYLKVQLTKMMADVHDEHGQGAPRTPRARPKGLQGLGDTKGTGHQGRTEICLSHILLRAFLFHFLSLFLRNVLTQFLNEVEIDIDNSTPQSNVRSRLGKLQRKISTVFIPFFVSTNC